MNSCSPVANDLFLATNFNDKLLPFTTVSQLNRNNLPLQHQSCFDKFIQPSFNTFNIPTLLRKQYQNTENLFSYIYISNNKQYFACKPHCKVHEKFLCYLVYSNHTLSQPTFFLHKFDETFIKYVYSQKKFVCYINQLNHPADVHIF